MRLRILALFAATAVGLAPVWAETSENGGGDYRTKNAAASGQAPTSAELAGATFSGIENQGPVTLRAGKWQGQPLIEDGASVPALWLSEGFRLTGDLDRDGDLRQAFGRPEDHPPPIGRAPVFDSFPDHPPADSVCVAESLNAPP